MDWLSDQDRSAIERSEFNPELKPKYSGFRSYIYWDDEMPEDLSLEGLEVVQDLLIYRSHVFHRHRESDTLPLDPNHFVTCWNRARQCGLRWAGFHRLELSKDTLVYMEDCDDYVSNFGP